MKKFFTLIALAIVALTANASVSLDLPSTWWDPYTVPEGGVYNFSGSWAGAGTWLGTTVDDVTTWYDATGYDYAVCIYESHTGGDVAFGVTYNHWEKAESWGDVYSSTSALIDQEKGYVAIALDKTSKSDGEKTYYEEIRQISLQDQGTAASVTITGIYLMTSAEYEALQNDQPLGPKEKDLNNPATYNIPADQMSSGWNSPGWIGKTASDLADYKTFVVEMQPEHECQLVIQDWDGSNGNMHTYLVSGSTETVKVCVPLDETGIQGVGQIAVQNRYIVEYNDPSMDPSSGQMIENNVYGDNTVVLSRIYVTSEVVESTYTPWEDPTGITEVKAENANSNVMYNIAGQRVSNAKGLVIKNGKKFLAK